LIEQLSPSRRLVNRTVKTLWTFMMIESISEIRNIGGDVCVGRPPPQILGTVPRCRPLSLRPCMEGVHLVSAHFSNAILPPVSKWRQVYEFFTFYALVKLCVSISMYDSRIWGEFSLSFNLTEIQIKIRWLNDLLYLSPFLLRLGFLEWKIP